MDDPASSFFFLFQEGVTSASPTFGGVLFDFFVIFLIVGMNAFFVASEFALVSSRRARIQTLADSGSGGAAAVLRLVNNPTLFISAVQLGVTLSSLALGWFGEGRVAQLLEPWADYIASEPTANYIAHGVAI